MKVLVEGRKEVKPWWIGQRVRCRDCGRMVELEAGDQERIAWIQTQSSSEVKVYCETCTGVMTLKRMLCPNARLTVSGGPGEDHDK
jgi:hypothetical protein